MEILSATKTFVPAFGYRARLDASVDKEGKSVLTIDNAARLHSSLPRLVDLIDTHNI
jgi:hypothetical protein